MAAIMVDIFRKRQTARKSTAKPSLPPNQRSENVNRADNQASRTSPQYINDSDSSICQESEKRSQSDNDNLDEANDNNLGDGLIIHVDEEDEELKEPSNEELGDEELGDESDIQQTFIDDILGEDHTPQSGRVPGVANNLSTHGLNSNVHHTYRRSNQLPIDAQRRGERPTVYDVHCNKRKESIPKKNMDNIPKPPAKVSTEKTGRRTKGRPKKQTKRKSPQKPIGNMEFGKMFERVGRVKPGTKALRVASRFFNLYKPQIPKLSFQKYVRYLTNEMAEKDNKMFEQIRFQSTALEALQEATETYLINFFEDSNLACLHGKRVTLMDRDMNLIKRLRMRHGEGLTYTFNP